jgi:hypothetical protein
LPSLIRARMLPHVSEGVHRRARATLEIDPDARSPEGELNAADGLRIGFVGWTELASAIERWREHAARESDEPDHGDRVSR